MLTNKKSMYFKEIIGFIDFDQLKKKLVSFLNYIETRINDIDNETR